MENVLALRSDNHMLHSAPRRMYLNDNGHQMIVRKRVVTGNTLIISDQWDAVSPFRTIHV